MKSNNNFKNIRGLLYPKGMFGLELMSYGIIFGLISFTIFSIPFLLLSIVLITVGLRMQLIISCEVKK